MKKQARVPIDSCAICPNLEKEIRYKKRYDDPFSDCVDQYISYSCGKTNKEIDRLCLCNIQKECPYIKGK